MSRMTFQALIVWMFEYEPLDQTVAGRVLKRILALLLDSSRRLPPSD